MSSIDDESWAKFLTPWKFDNSYGVPEVPYEDVVFSIDTNTVDSRLGRGKKGSVWEASWKGQKIAFKYWREIGFDVGPYSEWEILNYCRLKAVQGSLIPKLLFVSRNASGKRVLGLELGRPIDDCCEAEMKAVNERLAKHGWMQRDGSLRHDNFVRMGKENRLVAIDLESFIPAFPRSLRHDLQSPTISHGSFLGIPIVEPSEVEIEGCRKSWEWSTNNYTRKAMWGGTEVTLYSYHFEKDQKSLKLLLERNDLLKKAQGSLIATPLFLARERDGTILLGYEESEFVLSKEKHEAVINIFLDLIKLGWTFQFDLENFCELDNKILFRDLSCLLPNEDPPNAQCVSSDEMSSPSHDQGASDADEASQLPSSMTLRPLPHRINNKVSSPDSENKIFSDHRRVRISNVEIPLGGKHDRNPKQDRRLVPSLYLSNDRQSDIQRTNAAGTILSSSSPSIVRHLQWMMAKDSMNQDMLLVGPPGAGEVFRRRLALAYSELTEQPIEVLSISGDLTESDLKQRREIVQKTIANSSNPTTEIEFVDQAPVRAAKHGRLLLLDGIEKAERNVLPTLNNLLENREMHLEDGTMLLPSRRLQELKSENNRDLSTSSSSFLKPVHPDFRVIALGVPSPPFPGRSLDPPLRSRFQIRRIDNPSSEELYEQILQHIGATQNDIIDQEDDVVALAKSCAIFAGAMESSGKQFPSNRLHSVYNLISQFPLEDPSTILERAFPNMDNEAIGKEKTTLNDFSTLFQSSIKASSSEKTDRCLSNYTIKSVDESLEDSTLVKIELQPEPNTERSDECLSFHALKGNRSIKVDPSPDIVHTSSFRKTLSTMVQEHSVGNDFLLVSPKGEGKTTLVREFASLLGYETHLYAMNTEMTSQHLLQRRATDPSSGETHWEDSPLVRAARRGDICVLDGVEKLRPDVLSSIQSLMVDRDVQLPDGRRALRHDRIIVENSTEDDPYIKVHPSFRVIALASLPRGDDGSRWMTPSLMAMFSTISLPSLKEECLREIMKRYTSSDAASSAINTILELREELSDSVAEECGVAPLSTRNMVRTVRRMGTQNDLHHVLSSIFLFDLLPSRQRDALEEIFNRIGISGSPRNENAETESKIEVSESEAKIGSLVFQRGNVTRPEMVPSPQAFDIPAHTQIIKELLNDWQSGERSFLLLGNQGVGKNKIVDRICEIANWEREYIQLHRDSTIGQLTLTPQLEDGRIVWNDSPLIRAVRDGCVLLIDEADKAPVEVVSVLKGLVEDGELLLADGRRISRHGDGSDDNIIPIHPNFSLWVLANRPGFPFLGNDFFREIGDCFDTRVVNNPDLQSEIQLLASYAPNLDQEVIRALASSFSDLRSLSDNGDLTYPYSTREAIAVVKHLQQYPQDGLDVALHNVLDFDSYDTQTYMILGEAFERHGIAISDSLTWKEELLKYKSTLGGDSRGDLSIEFLGSNRGEDGESTSPPVNSSPKFGKWDDNNEIHVGGNQWAGGTGGSDTAGLGGRGGPYRLDRGHRVHQVSDKAKEEVSEDTKRAAKKMAKKALEEKLRKIGMGKEEYDMYKDFSANIQKDVSKLKSILSTIEFRTQERGWLKRQSYGEIDDSKIVDGITGDKYIYKRRGNVDEDSFSKEKYIRFVMDVSGSMYRFNGYDQRLIRCLEAALLVMESFPSDTLGEAKKFDYSMVGHSGDSPCIPFVDWSSAPKNEKDRLQILQTMLAHSQYCMSGDYTLEAMRRAIDEVSTKVGDANSGDNDKNGTVICLSDANLARYGIDPRRIGKLIEGGAKKGVKVYIVFIASFGEEAKAITRALPAGSGYICMETNELPKAVREILSSGVLK